MMSAISVRSCAAGNYLIYDGRLRNRAFEFMARCREYSVIRYFDNSNARFDDMWFALPRAYIYYPYVPAVYL